MYLRVLARPDLANKEQRKWAQVQAYVNEANDEATWTDSAAPLGSGLEGITTAVDWFKFEAVVVAGVEAE